VPAAQQAAPPAIEVRGDVSRRQPAGAREKEEVDVANPLVVGGGVHPLRPCDPLDGGRARPKKGAECRGLRRRQLSEGLGVAATDHEKLAGIGVGARMVCHEPEAVVVDDSAGSGRTAGDGVAVGARIGHLTRLPRSCKSRKAGSLDGLSRGSYHSISLVHRPPSGDRPSGSSGGHPRGASHERCVRAVLDGLKARLDQLLRDRARTDPRAYAAGMREAMLEAKVGLVRLHEALAISERELAVERKQLDDTERRGRLAAAVPDQETVGVAERFAAKHRKRIEVLVRKIAVQRDELILVQREIEEMAVEVRKAGSGNPADSISAAWQDLAAAGGSRPDADERVHADADRKRQEEAIEAQLAYLKRKMGKQQ
jgi:hypothetical protein